MALCNGFPSAAAQANGLLRVCVPIPRPTHPCSGRVMEEYERRTSKNPLGHFYNQTSVLPELHNHNCFKEFYGKRQFFLEGDFCARLALRRDWEFGGTIGACGGSLAATLAPATWRGPYGRSREQTKRVRENPAPHDKGLLLLIKQREPTRQPLVSAPESNSRPGSVSEREVLCRYWVTNYERRPPR